MTDDPCKKQAIPEDLRSKMVELAQILDAIFGPGRGFALFVFSINNDPDPKISYICNSKRKDMIVALKEFIARSEGRYQGCGNRIS